MVLMEFSHNSPRHLLPDSDLSPTTTYKYCARVGHFHPASHHQSINTQSVTEITFLRSSPPREYSVKNRRTVGIFDKPAAEHPTSHK